MKGSGIMAKGTGINKKYKPTGALADIIGSTPVSYAQASEKIWDHIHDVGCQGEKGDGHSVTFNGRKYVGGQVIHCGECPMMKKFCGGKNKVAMVQLAKFTKKYMKEA
jgi:chromatin remodeling complex protein RSC6